MDDIVVRLRDSRYGAVPSQRAEAADEIERLRSQLVKQQDLLHRSSECIGALLAWTSNWTVPFEAEDEWLGDKDVAKRLIQEIAYPDDIGDSK